MTWWAYLLAVFAGAVAIGVAMAAGFDLIGRRKPLPEGHRRCRWCRQSGPAVDMLFHEVEEHRP